MVLPVWDNGFLGACLLIAVMLMLRKILGKELNPNIRYFLWSFVALRILIPVHFVVTLPDTEFTEKLQNLLFFAYFTELESTESVQEIILQSNDELLAGQKNIVDDSEHEGRINLPLEPDSGYAAGTLSLAPSGKEKVMAGGEPQGKGVSTILGAFWLCGALGILGFLLIKNAHFYHKVKAGRKQVKCL